MNSCAASGTILCGRISLRLTQLRRPNFENAQSTRFFIRPARSPWGGVGGVAGYFIFSLLLSQGVYALAIPGALLGLSCGFCTLRQSHVLGAVAAVAAIVLGVFAEWRFFPFIADESFWYFVQHLDDLKPITMIMIAVGGGFGYWFGRGPTGGGWLGRTIASMFISKEAK